MRNIMQGHILSVNGDALTPSPHGHMLKEDIKNEVLSSWDVLQHWIVPNIYARSWLEKNWRCWESCLQIAIDAKAFCIVLYISQLLNMSWKQSLKNHKIFTPWCHWRCLYHSHSNVVWLLEGPLMVIKMVLRILTIVPKKIKDPVLVYNQSFQIFEKSNNQSENCRFFIIFLMPVISTFLKVIYLVSNWPKYYGTIV